MLDVSKRQHLSDLEVGDVVDILSKLPRRAKFAICGMENFFIHVQKDNTVVCLDTDDLHDDYFAAERTTFEQPVDINNVLQYKQGLKPIYAGKLSTHRGIANCPECNVCLCNLLYNQENHKVIGWFDNMCVYCETEIDWSEADKYL